MIYVDASVILAYLLAETRRPAKEFWTGSVVSSRLVAFEAWTTINGRGLAASHGQSTGDLLANLPVLELAEPVLRRAGSPMPIPLRTLDALHLATADFLREQGVDVAVASFDRRMNEAARALGFELHDPANTAPAA